MLVCDARSADLGPAFAAWQQSVLQLSSNMCLPVTFPYRVNFD